MLHLVPMISIASTLDETYSGYLPLFGPVPQHCSAGGACPVMLGAHQQFYIPFEIAFQKTTNMFSCIGLAELTWSHSTGRSWQTFLTHKSCCLLSGVSWMFVDFLWVNTASTRDLNQISHSTSTLHVLPRANVNPSTWVSLQTCDWKETSCLVDCAVVHLRSVCWTAGIAFLYCLLWLLIVMVVQLLHWNPLKYWNVLTMSLCFLIKVMVTLYFEVK